MEDNKNIEVIKKLSENLDTAGIQRTDKNKTHKGYDTTGFGYQYDVDRFNEILGTEWGYSWEIIHYEKGAYQSGQPCHDITVRVYIWIIDRKNCRDCVGGHTSSTYADALKGAMTNGFKKTAAFFGVGREAYAGEIDDDNKPLPDEHKNKVQPPKLSQKEYAMKYLDELPQIVKDFFKTLEIPQGSQWDFCKKHNFDIDMIREEAEKETNKEENNE